LVSQVIEQAQSRAPATAQRCTMIQTVPRHPLLILVACLWGIAACLFSYPAHAQCQSSPRNTSSLHLQIENDVFSGSKQDQGYSSGLKIAWVSPDLSGGDDCLPAAARPLHRALHWLQPAGDVQRNMVMALEQMLFTPYDKTRRDRIATDRPYAATLMLSLGYQARQNDRLRTNVLSLGVVGPAALGERVQNGVHHALGNRRFRGWHNQLKNEAIAQVAYEDRHRWAGARTPSAWGWDAMAYWGGTLGNLAAHLNAGGELRYGLHLPNDFGTGRLAGANTAPPGSYAARGGWAGHLFVAFDVRAVARDLTLDGSTWHHSHKVDKRHVVTELGYGLALRYDRWNLTLGRYHRTREFNGQAKRPVFGGVRVGYQF